MLCIIFDGEDMREYLMQRFDA